MAQTHVRLPHNSLISLNSILAIHLMVWMYDKPIAFGEHRKGRRVDMKCSTCGTDNPANARFCGNCRQSLVEESIESASTVIGATESPRSSKFLAIPITSLVLGIIGLITLFDPGWDMETAVGVLILFGIPPIVLGVISIAKTLQGKLMGIIGLILGCINSVGMIVIMATM